MKKYGLKAEVKEGSSNEILNEYIGHIENTSTYDGNVGLAGHNRGNKNSYFARLNELENGDIITYKTILETDWNLLKETDQNKLTLITCIANKKLQRLCVQATEIVENNLK